VFKSKFSGFNYTTSYLLLTFEGIFNQIQIIKSFLNLAYAPILEDLVTKYNITEPLLLLNYYRYIMYYFAFNGIT